MSILSIEYPDTLPTLINQTREEFEFEARMSLAVKLYERGRLTSGQAADIVGMPRSTFLVECIRYGCPSVSWDEEEIEQEKLAQWPK